MSQCIAKTNDNVEDFTKGCQAKEYDNCDGWHSLINVLFLYRDSKGRHREDEHVKIGVCEYHRKWLVKLHNGFPLEMRGEEPYYAMHDDLFIPFFAQDNTIYTLLQIEFALPVPNKDDDEEKKKDKKQKKEKQFMLFNGRGIKPFKTVLCENDDRIKRISVKGIFQTCFQRTAIECACAEKTTECTMFVCETAPQIIETVIELTEIDDEMALDALVATENLGVYKKPAIAYDENEAEKKYDTHDYFSDEPLPAIIRQFFTTKKAEADYEEFVNCTEFIHDNISSNIIYWQNIREESPHIGLPLLFQQVQQLTSALLLDDKEAIAAMRNADSLSDDVLWSVYVMANHELYHSQNEEKNELLKKNARLVELFLENGLGNPLLALAISGERLRDLTIHSRDHHDILRENIFVVQMLVPKHIPAKHLFYNESYAYEKNKWHWMTPLEYFEDFSNKTYSINPFQPPETFEKNADIHQYLLSQ